MFPVLHHIPDVLLDPGTWARRAWSIATTFFLSILILFHSSLIYILDFGCAPPTPNISVPTFADLFAIIRDLVYPLPGAWGTYPPGYRCIPHTLTSTFPVCVSDATYADLTSVFTPPSVHDVVVILVLWTLSVCFIYLLPSQRLTRHLVHSFLSFPPSHFGSRRLLGLEPPVLKLLSNSKMTFVIFATSSNPTMTRPNRHLQRTRVSLRTFVSSGYVIRYDRYPLLTTVSRPRCPISTRRSRL